MKTREELINLGIEGFKADQLMLLQEEMLHSAVCFQYRKKDGTVRNAVGTLSRCLMKMADGKLWEPVGEAKPEVPENFRYWDLEKQMWREMKVANFVRMEG